MFEYELHLLGPAGQVERTVVIIADDDPEALARARHFWHPHAMELWDGERKVDRFAPPRSPDLQRAPDLVA